GAGAGGVGGEGFGPRPAHMGLEQGDAGNLRQQPADVGGAGQGQPTPGPGAAEIESEDGPGAPAQPFKEVVGVTRPGPEAGIADAATVGGIDLEGRELPVGDPFRYQG